MHIILSKLVKLLIYITELLNLKSLGIKKLTHSLGLNSLISNRRYYENVKDIREIEVKVYSQNGEDG
mgnify:CR=1